SHSIKIFSAYLSIILFTLTLVFLSYNKEIYNAMSAMVVMFYIVILSSGLVMHSRLMENIKLRFKSIQDDRKIQDTELSLHNLFDATPMGIFLFDLTTDDRLLFSGFNIAAEKILSHGCQTFMAKELETVFPALSGTDIPDLFRRIATETAQWDQREIHYHSDNINGIYEISVFQVRKNQIAIIFSDISERKKLEQQILASKDAAEAANLAKSTFLSNMSHELRTPLNAIIGFAQLLSMKKLQIDEMDKKGILEIKNAGSHLLALIDELLDMAKIETGNIKLERGKLRISNIIRECTTLIKHSLTLRNVKLEYNALSCEEILVYADYTRTKQLILNLLSNAVKYNRDNGEILISCKSDHKNIKIEIQDTGIGIPEENISDLFTPFQRLGISEHIEGTGIGLMISRDLAVMMKGDISVKSKFNEGSTFTITLPLYIND
ncbi:MAG: PAS domain-containing sensor histidine kinase, partial [Spirochaetia bacterium]|nr:PAS domain-containing sensor histidine kinase [Spirochaetia bacterium]